MAELMNCILLAAILGCGINNVYGLQDGLNVTDATQFPYQALLFCAENATTLIPLCSGVIVDTNTVLSTASCINKTETTYNIYKYKIFVGSNKMPASLNTKTGKIYNLTKAIYLPKENSPISESNDLALFNVATNFDFKDRTIQSVNLADSYNATMLSDCYISSWNITNSNSNSSFGLLQYTSAMAVKSLQCMGLNDLPQHTFCFANVTGVVTNEADVGGPVVCNGKLMAIASRSNNSGITTNTVWYNRWIQSQGEVIPTESPTTQQPITTANPQTDKTGTPGPGPQTPITESPGETTTQTSTTAKPVEAGSSTMTIVIIGVVILIVLVIMIIVFVVRKL